MTRERKTEIDLTTPQGIKQYLDGHPRIKQLMVTREVLEELFGIIQSFEEEHRD